MKAFVGVLNDQQLRAVLDRREVLAKAQRARAKTRITDISRLGRGTVEGLGVVDLGDVLGAVLVAVVVARTQALELGRSCTRIFVSSPKRTLILPVPELPWQTPLPRVL